MLLNCAIVLWISYLDHIRGVAINGGYHQIRDHCSSSSSLLLTSHIKCPSHVGPAACLLGKTGVFLSENWGDGIQRDALFQMAFPLHEELAQDLNVESFRMLPSFQADLKETAEEGLIDNHRSSRTDSCTREHGASFEKGASPEGGRKMRYVNSC
eukprot:scaffold140217_cov59-Attheya_sp.AAC.1